MKSLRKTFLNRRGRKCLHYTEQSQNLIVAGRFGYKESSYLQGEMPNKLHHLQGDVFVSAMSKTM